MKSYKIKIHGKDYQVEVEDFQGNQAKVNVNGTSYDVEVEGAAAPKVVKPAVRPAAVKAQSAPKAARVAVAAAAPAAAPAAGAGHKVLSPLPGAIFKIVAKVGDTVKVGDLILTMEAMKMENNIMADKAGTLSAINVKVGDTVLQGDSLAEII